MSSVLQTQKQVLRSQKMARTFELPIFYKSAIISTIKEARRISDPRKKDLSPTILDFGEVRFKIARHFGFCYGVEQAVEIAYRAIDENPSKRIFLLSEMIHNQQVNEDLQARGIRFLRSTSGDQLIPFSDLASDDVVIIPAFGTSLEVEQELADHHVAVHHYDTTCPFVMKVWKRSTQIGQGGYTVIMHGKHTHEETRATFSRAKEDAPVVVVRDMAETQVLAQIIKGEVAPEVFFVLFEGRYSEGFDPSKDLRQIGVVNQTTMLATETQAIAEVLRQAVKERFGAENLSKHFADTSDTLCYATNENQTATRALIDSGGDLAIIVGGYNSSNTSHLVELCEEAMPTYFVCHADEIESPQKINHFSFHAKKRLSTSDWLPLDASKPVDIVLTAGASCPDSLLDEVLLKILKWFPNSRSIDDVILPFIQS